MPDDRGIAFATILNTRFVGMEMPNARKGTPAAWYWGDLKASRLEPLESIIPEKGKRINNILGAGDHLMGPFTPRRWRIRFGYLWGCYVVNPGSSLSQDRSFFQLEFGWYQGFRKSHLVSEDIPTINKSDWPRRGGRERVFRGREDAMQRIARGDMLKSMPMRDRFPNFYDYDFLPCDSRDLQLFLLIDDVMEVWQYHFKGGRVQYLDNHDAPTWKEDVWLGEWTHDTQFSAPFSEAFFVTESPGAVAFVTDSGKCYVACKNTDGIWTCSPVWDDESRPLIAMIDVPDKKESYAFGKDFYFLLGGKPVPVQCRDVTLNGSDHGEPIRTSWQCAKVLYADARITAQRDETPRSGPSDAQQNPQ